MAGNHMCDKHTLFSGRLYELHGGVPVDGGGLGGISAGGLWWLTPVDDPYLTLCAHTLCKTPVLLLCSPFSRLAGTCAAWLMLYDSTFV